MKLYNIFKVGALASATLFVTGCADDLKDTNIDPANVSETKPEGLMMAAINEFNPIDYMLWFYNVNHFTQWSQMGTSSGGFDAAYTTHAAVGGQGGQYISPLKYYRRIDSYIEQTGETKYNGYKAATKVLAIYLGIFDSDMYGSMPWEEACHYDDLGIVTPKYDNVETLYNTWINELDECIALFNGSELDAINRQDAAYGADWKKWAKLANTLKLKIAVRLYNNDASKANSIASEAASNAAGLITSTDDSFLFAKATDGKSNVNWDYVYNTGNGLATQYGTANVINFMLGSKDPRVRFIYTKNSYNSKVVQSFIDYNMVDSLPGDVKKNIEFDENGNFKAWKGMGEPWVRYVGVPVTYSPRTSYESGKISKDFYTEYFNPGERYQVKKGDYVVNYGFTSYYTHEMRQGRVDFSLPTAIEANEDGTYTRPVIQDTEDNPLYTMYLGAGEVNLYMAEFALLNGGSFGGKSAEAWYEAGVRASVEDFDKLARLNKIPYYGTTYDYDPFEVSIELKNGEIDDMLATDNVKLTGSTADKLEKVYLQLMMHFSEQPDDQYVTARRSGYPKVGSSLLPYVKFDEVALSAIPRRFIISEPTIDDLMIDVKKAAYSEMGITIFGDPSVGTQFNGGDAPLNVQRLWQDKSAPQWGTPNN